jgi:hypothetical protein
MTGELTGFLGHKIVGPTFHAFVDKLQQTLPDKILRITVQKSVQSLLKQELTEDLLLNTCWRLAGNLDKLLNQQPVDAWVRQKEFEWALVQVCDVFTSKKINQLMHTFTFQSQSGSIVPLKLTQNWSLKKTNYLALYRNNKHLGFGFRRSDINNRGEQRSNSLYHDVRQFYGLRCFLLLDPKRSQADPVAVEVGHTSATMTHNKQLISARDRLQSKCLRGFPDTVECFQCPYGTDNCVLATHKLTYRKAVCPKCAKLWFLDPAELDFPGLCINCVREERLK